MPERTPAVFGEVVSEAIARDLAEAIKPLADPTRLQIISVLAAPVGDQCSETELAVEVRLAGGPTMLTVHHHLQVLATSGFIAGERLGREVRHRLLPDAVHAVAVRISAVAR